MKINKSIAKRRKESVDHLNRIQGQINTLKKYLESDADCFDIALLTMSIAKSFDSLKSKTLEGSIINQILKEKGHLSEKEKKQIHRIIELYGK